MPATTRSGLVAVFFGATCKRSGEPVLNGTDGPVGPAPNVEDTMKPTTADQLETMIQDFDVKSLKKALAADPGAIR